MARHSSLKKRNQRKEIFRTFLFYLSSAGLIVALIAYLMIYTSIDESVVALGIQKTTLKELQSDVSTLENRVDYLSRPDVIALKARQNLDMVTVHPESIIVYLDSDIRE